jgi:predicted HicB family RNase H-like nuclease
MGVLRYKGYIGSVEYSETDNCLCGKVLGMTKDSITYEGTTLDELKKDFEDGIESYIEGCKEMGIVPRKAYNGVLNIRIPSETHCKVAMITENTGTSINAFIRDSINRTINESKFTP